MFFHWKYLSEKGMGGQGAGRRRTCSSSRTARARGRHRERRWTRCTRTRRAATRTETERAFQAGFVSMYGNVPFLIGVIGLAVVFAILLVAANTMMMAIRERTSEIGVMKTLGFEDGTMFRIVLAEAGAHHRSAAASLGALLAKCAHRGLGLQRRRLPAADDRPLEHRARPASRIAVLMGAVSGLIPAWQASRLHDRGRAAARRIAEAPWRSRSRYNIRNVLQRPGLDAHHRARHRAHGGDLHRRARARLRASRRRWSRPARPSNAIVLRKGADSEISSGISRDGGEHPPRACPTSRRVPTGGRS